jgi:pimeloyl-ACP methyl ester carboxylesterase
MNLRHSSAGTQYRTSGVTGRLVVLLHGGPGTPGYLLPLAEALSGRFRVVEPFERRSGETPLTVAGHVADICAVIDAEAPGTRPALVGHSWGAMLALCVAAEFPVRVAGVAAVCPGTFNQASRAEFHARLDARLTPDARDALRRLEDTGSPDRDLATLGRLLLPAYCHAGDVAWTEPAWCDARGHDESWADMLRLQARGLVPQRFSEITCPVAMFHGADDPHPGDAIASSLRPYLPQLDYRRWPACGHYPWLEPAVAHDFLATLTSWLDRVHGSQD